MIDNGATITIDRDTLRTWLERGEPVAVLDVRPAAERAEWAIPGSLHVDAYDSLWAGDTRVLDHASLPPGQRVVTVCNGGRTSLFAALALRARGIDAVSLAGGMTAWSLAWNTADVALPAAPATAVQVRRTGKGCLSYVIASEDEAALIDPAVDPEVFEWVMHERGWRLCFVLDTHIHADHVSRSRVLAERWQVPLYLPETQRARYAHSPLRDGDTLPLGSSRLDVLRTPGHTMESTCYLLEGQLLFTGDTLFLAAVGRPDLEATPEETRDRAQALYRSLKRLSQLPPETLVLPSHTDDPVAFNRRPLAAPLGAVLDRIELLRESEQAFVHAVTPRIPATPPNHRLIVKLNEAGVFPGGDLGVFEAGANRCAVR